MYKYYTYRIYIRSSDSETASKLHHSLAVAHQRSTYIAPHCHVRPYQRHPLWTYRRVLCIHNSWVWATAIHILMVAIGMRRPRRQIQCRNVTVLTMSMYNGLADPCPSGFAISHLPHNPWVYLMCCYSYAPLKLANRVYLMKYAQGFVVLRLCYAIDW